MLKALGNIIVGVALVAANLIAKSVLSCAIVIVFILKLLANE